jgi:NarL family two-component system response regulator LiaR
MIRVVLADDHRIVRAGLMALLASQGDFEVVGEASDGREALEAAERLRPDVLLLDLSMPGLNGVEALRRVRAVSPTTRVLVLSMHAAPEYVRPALAAGAAGYVVKGAGLEDLVDALRTVASGGRFLGPEARRVVEAATLDLRPAGEDQLMRLTPREREVLQLVAEGHTNREIATLLGCAPKTVDAHRTRLMQKLDLHDAQAVTRFAMRRGLISPE